MVNYSFPILEDQKKEKILMKNCKSIITFHTRYITADFLSLIMGTELKLLKSDIVT